MSQTPPDAYDLVEAVGVPACICGPDGSIRFANAKARALWKGSAAEYPDWRVLFQSTAADQTSVQVPILAAIQQGRSVTGECTFQPPLGQPLQLLVHAAPLPNQPGEPPTILVTLTDLTLWRSRERELANQRMQWDTLIEATAVSVVFTDRQGLVTYMNAVTEKLTGYAAAEAVGKLSLQQLFDTHYTQGFIQRMAREMNMVGFDPPAIFETYLRKKRCLTGEHRLLTKAGTSLPVSATICAFLDASGTVLGYLTKAVDLSPVQHLEIDLADKNSKLGLAVEAAKLGIWEHNYQSDQTCWDEETYRLYGVDVSRPITWEFYLSLIHAEDRALFIRRTQEALTADTFHVVLRILRADTGQLCFIESTGKVLRDEAGLPIRLLGVARDVTQGHQERLALAASEWRFKHLAEQVNEIFWIRSIQDGQFVYLNPAFERSFGIDREALNTNPTLFFEQILEEDRPAVRAVYQQAAVGPIPYVFRFRNAQGELRWMEASAVTLYASEQDNPVGYRAGVARDITLQREHEQNLEKALLQEQTLNQLKKDFITTASHEFRTPLTVISSSTELLQHYLGQLPTHPMLPGMARHLTAIVTKVQALNTLISDTLTLSQLDEGQIKVHWQAMDLVAFCQELLQTSFEERADQRRVAMSVQGVVVAVQSDPKLLSPILMNLVSNAFKYSTHNPSLTIRFAERQVELTVSDRGIGIPADELVYLFSRFFRARNAAAYPGTGLGLVICQQYSSLLGGQLTVNSIEGVGTQFTLRLPFQKSFLPGEL